MTGTLLLAALVAAVVALSFAVLILARIIAKVFHRLERRPVRLAIVFTKGVAMGAVTVGPGQSKPFQVVAKNAAGNVVPAVDPIAVATDSAAIATATVDAVTGAAVLSGVADGDTSLRATSGGLTADPWTVKVFDAVPVTLEIQFPEATP